VDGADRRGAVALSLARFRKTIAQWPDTPAATPVEFPPTPKRSFVMNKTMKAAVVRAFDQPLAIEVPVPAQVREDVLVKIEACGVCHTDLHAAEGDWPVKPNPPFIPGHEGGLRCRGGRRRQACQGGRPRRPWLYSACGHCTHCLGGWETLCESQQNTGYSVNGGFAEYALGNADYVGHLPANVGFVEIAPVLCAGVTVYKGLKVTDTKPGDWVVIWHRRPGPYGGAIRPGHGPERGGGGCGRHQAQACRAPGRHSDRERLEHRSGGVSEEIGGAHGALVTAVSPKAFAQATGMVRRGGTMSLVGLPPGDFPLDIFGMVLNGITVRGSIVGSRLIRRSRWRLPSRPRWPPPCQRPAGEHQRHLRAHACRPDRGPHRARHGLRRCIRAGPARFRRAPYPRKSAHERPCHFATPGARAASPGAGDFLDMIDNLAYAARARLTAGAAPPQVPWPGSTGPCTWRCRLASSAACGWTPAQAMAVCALRAAVRPAGQLPPASSRWSMTGALPIPLAAVAVQPDQQGFCCSSNGGEATTDVRGVSSTTKWSNLPRANGWT
jgi:propanol-preferring alcohol dehydrogenase